jgi:hypothetical protein
MMWCDAMRVCVDDLWLVTCDLWLVTCDLWQIVVGWRQCFLCIWHLTTFIKLPFGRYTNICNISLHEQFSVVCPLRLKVYICCFQNECFPELPVESSANISALHLATTHSPHQRLFDSAGYTYLKRCLGSRYTLTAGCLQSLSWILAILHSGYKFWKCNSWKRLQFIFTIFRSFIAIYN